MARKIAWPVMLGLLLALQFSAAACEIRCLTMGSHLRASGHATMMHCDAMAGIAEQSHPSEATILSESDCGSSVCKVDLSLIVRNSPDATRVTPIVASAMLPTSSAAPLASARTLCGHRARDRQCSVSNPALSISLRI
jgi:hypothetical protein